MLVNLTPHSITLFAEQGKIVIPPSGRVARVSTAQTVLIERAGIKIITQKFGDIAELPDPMDGTFYIVAALVAQAATSRPDLITVADLVWGDDGQVIGARALCVHPNADVAALLDALRDLAPRDLAPTTAQS